MQLARLAIYIGTGLLLASAVYSIRFNQLRQAEVDLMSSHSALHRLDLAETLDRYDHFTKTLSDAPAVVAAFDGQSDQASRWLADLVDDTGMEAAYLLDTDGTTIAASNYRDAVTFLGQNYGFRPYFKAAMKGEQGEFFAIGATTSRPGYFFAGPVALQGRIIGVIAVKIDLSTLVDRWRRYRETVLVSNRDGIVVLSTDDALRYRGLRKLKFTRRQEIQDERQFGKETLPIADWQPIRDNLVKIDDTRFIHVSEPLDRAGWEVHVLDDEKVVIHGASMTVLAVIAGLAALVLVWLFLRAERMRHALTVSQTERRKLAALNIRLKDEVTERETAENALRAAQSSLRQTSRLAALGELAAMVTHELGQPLSAMRNYLAAAEMRGDRANDPLVPQLDGVIDRMEQTTRQLRNFARSGNDAFEPVDLVRVVRDAHTLLAHDIASAGVEYRFHSDVEAMVVAGDAHRLEQVVVNLMRNALAAMEETENKLLDVSLTTRPSSFVMTVRDTGIGLGEETIATLQEAFFTTRPSGGGMGLGLAISAAIACEHDAELDAANHPDTGSIFTVRFSKDAYP